MTSPVDDAQFRAILATAVPALVDAIATAPAAPATGDLAGRFSQSLTDRGRVDAAAYTIIGLAKARLHAQFGERPFSVIGVADHGNGPQVISGRDDAPPFVHTFQWFVDAVIRGDDDMAAATLASIPDEEAVYLIRSSLELAGQVTCAANAARKAAREAGQ